MPFMIAAMPCSRMPKCTYRDAYSPGAKFFHVLTEVLFEGVRSADPPTSSGSDSAVALRTAPNAARLATLPFSLVKVGILAAQFGGRLPASRRSSSLASSGNALAYAARQAVHSA